MFRCCALALSWALLAAGESNYAADVEERLWSWVRESGGFVSESVGAAPLGNMRSVRALKDIPADELIIEIPRSLQLVPEESREGNAFYQQLHALNLPLESVDFAMYILREVRRRAARRDDPLAAAEDYDRMWDWLEFHLKAVGDYVETWSEVEVQLLGADQAALAAKSKREMESAYDAVVRHLAKQCPTGSEPSCKHVEGMGEISRDDFHKAVHMTWSRRFDAGESDVRMIVPVASLLNHRPPTQSTATFEIGDKAFSVWSYQNIKAGEEITITYGNWHNHQLLFEHAFTQPPFVEPNSFFFVSASTLKKDIPELASRRFELRLSTPFLYSDPDDPWEADDTWNFGGVARLVIAHGLPVFGKLIDFYAEGLARDPLLQPFIEQLGKNRAQNRSSRVWWADEANAEQLDTSSSDALGSERRSHTIRVLMSRVLCLTIYREALLIEKGEMDAGSTMVSAEELSFHLKSLKIKAGVEARAALRQAVQDVKFAVAKAKFAGLPAKDVATAVHFIEEMSAIEKADL